MRSVPRRLRAPGASPVMAAFWMSRVCARWRRSIFQTKGPPMIDKSFDQIIPEDITELVRHGVYENQLLEFKRELPGERGRPDPWLTGADFTAYARDHLLREVTAFANAEGGTVIVGMDQTRDDPPRAAAICTIPRIH